jgi:hypothetical protein
MSINHKMVPYLTENDIADAFQQKYNEDIHYLCIPYILFDDDFNNDSAKKLYINDPWWRHKNLTDYDEARTLFLIMEMLFEEFYPQRYVLVDTSW